jgi:hypothetical protein
MSNISPSCVTHDFNSAIQFHDTHALGGREERRAEDIALHQHIGLQMWSGLLWVSVSGVEKDVLEIIEAENERHIILLVQMRLS